MTPKQAIATVALACGLGQPVSKNQVEHTIRKISPQAATIVSPVLRALPEVAPGVLDPTCLPAVHVRNRAKYRQAWQCRG